MVFQKNMECDVLYYTHLTPCFLTFFYEILCNSAMDIHIGSIADAKHTLQDKGSR